MWWLKIPMLGKSVLRAKGSPTVWSDDGRFLREILREACWAIELNSPERAKKLQTRISQHKFSEDVERDEKERIQWEADDRRAMTDGIPQIL